MHVVKSTGFEFERVTDEHVSGAEIAWPIRAPEDAPNFSMRIIRIAPGGRVGLHEHSYEHEVYVMEGEGTLDGEGATESFKSGDVCYVEPGVIHGFTNTGNETLQFVCVIPNK